jgi:hypothetical protein
MIDELGNYLSAEFGRCDRSNSCGYFNYPQNANSDIKLDLALQNVRHLPKKDGPPSEIPDYYVEQSQKEYGMNAIYQYLNTLFSSAESVNTAISICISCNAWSAT